MPYDVVQHAYVRPIDKTPGLVYDQQNATYHYPGTVLDATGNWVYPKDPDADVHKANPAVGPVKPKVDPPEATTHGGDPVVPVVPVVPGWSQQWSPILGVDIPPGFYWDAADQVAVGPLGGRYPMEDQPGMWSEYWAQGVGYGDGDEGEGDEGDADYGEGDADEGDEVEGDIDSDPPEEIVVPTLDPVETAPKKIPDDHPAAGAHVHEEAPDVVDQPPLPMYMQHQHRDRIFQHSSAPMHLPQTHVKVI